MTTSAGPEGPYSVAKVMNLFVVADAGGPRIDLTLFGTARDAEQCCAMANVAYAAGLAAAAEEGERYRRALEEIAFKGSPAVSVTFDASGLAAIARAALGKAAGGGEGA